MEDKVSIRNRRKKERKELRKKVKKNQKIRDRIRYGELKEIAEENGDCRNCLKNPALFSMYLCEDCRKNQKVYSKRYRDKKKNEENKNAR